MEKGFIFRMNRCVGCHACIVACAIQNNTLPGMNWRSVYEFNNRKHPFIPVLFHSMACNHCEEAPCMTNCPSKAFLRDEHTNAVLVNPDKCIGCKYCAWACPYDAPKYNPKSGIIEKCNLCIERIRGDGIPACARCCPTGSLDYGLPDEFTVRQTITGFGDYGLGPKVYFADKDMDRRMPEMVVDDQFKYDPAGLSDSVEMPTSRIDLKSEWSLAVFTFLVPFLTGLFAGISLASIIFPWELFVAFGIMAIFVGSLHTGKKFRSFRSVVNFRNSWLSRETLSFILFFATAVYTLISGSVYLWLVITTLVFGLLASFSIDMVYNLKSRTETGLFHSSNAMLSVLLFTGIFLKAGYPVVFILALKLFLYTYRKIRFYHEGKDPRWLLSIFRLVPGMIFPALHWLTDPSVSWILILTSVIAGEITDRCEFYLELEFKNPENELYSYFKKIRETA
ncbi:MAG: 4Fe-4S dicluster domain-containing protein [Bacteroidales bacterium]|nr:MAG: 4Fe-4S dicluster domain-containing protein [Bacteroidales bacterium]